MVQRYPDFVPVHWEGLMLMVSAYQVTSTMSEGPKKYHTL